MAGFRTSTWTLSNRGGAAGAGSLTAGIGLWETRQSVAKLHGAGSADVANTPDWPVTAQPYLSGPKE